MELNMNAHNRAIHRHLWPFKMTTCRWFCQHRILTKLVEFEAGKGRKVKKFEAVRVVDIEAKPRLSFSSLWALHLSTELFRSPAKLASLCHNWVLSTVKKAPSCNPGYPRTLLLFGASLTIGLGSSLRPIQHYLICHLSLRIRFYWKVTDLRKMDNFDDMYATPPTGTKRRFDWSDDSSASPLQTSSRTMLPVPPPPPPPTMRPMPAASNSGSEVAEKRARMESEPAE